MFYRMFKRVGRLKIMGVKKMENKIFDYNKICEDIKSLDEKIQFVSIINADGNLITGGINGGSADTQSKRFYEELYEEVATRIKLRKKFDGLLGEVKGTIVIRNRTITMNFPLKENILFISADTSIDYGIIFEKIFKIIQE
ncbi:MAG: DUF6659 family protein [Nitrosopumilus sp.]